MRFWTKWAAILVALPLLATAASAQSITSADPGPERLALAREMLDAIHRPEIDADLVRLEELLLPQLLRGLMAFSGVALVPDLDQAQLNRSLEVGAAASVEQSREVFVDRFAREMTGEDMRAVIAFYTSPEGRAEVGVTTRFIDLTLTMLKSGNPIQPGERGSSEPSAASVAFNESAAGQALTKAASSQALTDAGIELRQNEIAAAQADYCAHVTCGVDQVEMFRRMSVRVPLYRSMQDQEQEHEMWFQTASDLFSDPNVAALARAACSGDAAAVAAAVGDGTDPNAIGGEGSGPEGSSQRVTPLLWAIDCGSVTGVEALLDAGADPNQREEFGATPVTVAAETREPAILQRLLTRGGDANAHDDRETALQIALKLASRLERVDGLPEATAWANWNALLAAGADPDRIAPDGAPLMQTASFMSQWKKVVWLIDRGWAGDPVDLGRTIETAQGQRGIPQDELDALAEVRTELVRRGVKFPVGALMDLPRDDRGFYIQR